MADDVRLDITSVAHNKGLVDAGREMRGLRSEATRLTGTLGELEDGSFSLDLALEETREEVVRLRQEFAKTGDTTLFGDMRRQQSTLTNLQKIKEAIEEVGEAADGAGEGGLGVAVGSAVGTSVGRGVSGGVLDALGGLPSKARGTAIVAGVTIGAIMAPAIGGAIAGAVTGGIGVGGIIGGVAAASRHPGVKAAWAEFAAGFNSDAFAGPAFVRPTIAAINELDAAWEGMNFGDSLEKLAPHTVTLARGIGDLGENFMPGFNRAMDEAGPLVANVAMGLGDLGSALGDSLAIMAESEGTADGLNTVFFLTNATIRTLGESVAWLGDRYHEAITFTNDVAGFFTEVPGLMGWAARQARSNFQAITGDAPQTLRAMDAFKAAAADIAWEFGGMEEAVRGANQELDRNMSLSMQIPASLDDYEEAIDGLTVSLKENGRTIDAGTEKGRENRDAFRDAIRSAQDYKTAQIEAGVSAGDANARYAAQIKVIEEIANKAGITKQQLEEMAGKYDIGIHYKLSISGREPRVTFGPAVKTFGGGFQEFASGGFVPGPKGAPQMAIVHGGEYVVSNAMQAGAQMMPAGLGGGSQRVEVVLRVEPNRDALFDFVVGEVRQRGGRPETIGIING